VLVGLLLVSLAENRVVPPVTADENAIAFSAAIPAAFVEIVAEAVDFSVVGTLEPSAIDRE
jgi:hypothetical protein